MSIKSKLVMALGALGIFVGISSCSPEAYVMSLEMRYPSEAGLDLFGKTISIVYLEGGEPSDSAFTYHVADGFAKRLEEEYFDSNPSVKLYKVKKTIGNYSSKDTLHNLVMDTSDDVVFLLDQPRFQKPTRNTLTGKWNVPFAIGLYVYDSMHKVDSVYTFSGKNSFEAGSEESSESIWKYASSPAYNVGYNSAIKFDPTWKKEDYTVIYFSDEQWLTALEYAYDFEWDKAMDIWMDLAKSKSPIKRACASYNVGLACYMLGDYDLAWAWLEQSDADNPVSPSSTLRRRIVNRRSLSQK